MDPAAPWLTACGTHISFTRCNLLHCGGSWPTKRLSRIFLQPPARQCTVMVVLDDKGTGGLPREDYGRRHRRCELALTAWISRSVYSTQLGALQRAHCRAGYCKDKVDRAIGGAHETGGGQRQEQADNYIHIATTRIRELRSVERLHSHIGQSGAENAPLLRQAARQLVALHVATHNVNAQEISHRLGSKQHQTSLRLRNQYVPDRPAQVTHTSASSTRALSSAGRPPMSSLPLNALWRGPPTGAASVRGPAGRAAAVADLAP